MTLEMLLHWGIAREKKKLAASLLPPAQPLARVCAIVDFPKPVAPVSRHIGRPLFSSTQSQIFFITSTWVLVTQVGACSRRKESYAAPGILCEPNVSRIDADHNKTREVIIHQDLAFIPHL